MRVALVLLLLSLLISGCAGPMFEGTIFEAPPRQNDPTVVQLTTDTGMLSQQVSSIMRSLEAVESRLATLESRMGAGVATHDEVVALRRDLQLVRSERDTLRREITDDLAGRVERIAARQQAEAKAAATRAAAAASSAPVRSATGYEHVVAKGQTLSEIARGYGKSVQSIMDANNIKNPSMIRVGQKLFIPD